jgi:hypothetical protein
MGGVLLNAEWMGSDGSVGVAPKGTQNESFSYCSLSPPISP